MYFRMKVLIAAVACLGLSVAAADAGYYTGFEESEGYVNGSIDGQLGWTVNTGVMNVNLTGVYTIPGVMAGTGRGEIVDTNGLPGVAGTAVTGDAYFTIYYNTSGNKGIQLFVGDEDLADDHMAAYIYNRNTGGVLKYQDGSTHLSGPTPPETGWWAIRLDFHWDADTSRYTSWDFKYAVVGDTDWTTIDTGLGFRSQDELGFNYDLSAVMPWNRPTISDKRGTMLVDEIYLGNDEPTLLTTYIHADPKPGDANTDGFVNEADAALLAGNWLKTGMAWGDGNFNGDDVVDDRDATLMAANWSVAVAANVPEPGTVVMLSALIAMLAAMLRRR